MAQFTCDSVVYSAPSVMGQALILYNFMRHCNIAGAATGAHSGVQMCFSQRC